jgi:hypothetical protein
MISQTPASPRALRCLRRELRPALSSLVPSHTKNLPITLAVHPDLVYLDGTVLKRSWAGEVRKRIRSMAAKIGGMARQALRDWLIPFNEQGRPASSAFLPLVCAQVRRLAQSLSRPDRGERVDPIGPQGGALAGMRSDHAAARGVWAFTTPFIEPSRSWASRRRGLTLVAIWSR